MHALSSEAATAGAAALAHAEPADAEALYRAHRPGLVRLAHLLTGSATAAEDVVQDAFIGLVRHKRTVREPLAYLRRSVVNLSTNRHRAAARERRHLAVLIDEGVAPPEIDETWRIIKDLPPRQRAVLVLRYYLDLSEADTAKTLGCRVGTVKSTASRALAKLKESMS